MAILIPHTPFVTKSEGEIDLFPLFKLQLSDEYYVFHSLRWIRGDHKFDGEIDFVIFHKEKGILLIEVKSGIIKYENRILCQENRNTGEKKEIDPIEQLRHSKYKLIGYLRQYISYQEFCQIGYAVWFPSYPFTGTLPPDMENSIVGDANSMKDVKSFIDNAYKYYLDAGFNTIMSRNTADRIVNALCGEFSIAPSLHIDFQEREKQFIRLTNEQARILDFLDEQEEAVISGVAGTGKTVLALEKAKRLAADKEYVLYVCFNKYLAKYLQENFTEPYVIIYTFHALAEYYTPKATYTGINGLETAFLDKLLNNEFKWEFQHLIIDEGQDFEEDWIEALQMHCPKTRYIFYDKEQNIFRDNLPEYIKNADCKLTLSRNCRNTKQIAKTAFRAVSIPTEKYVTQSVEGLKPFLIELANTKEGVDYIKKIIHRHLMETKGKMEDIVILTLKTEESSEYAKELIKLKYQISDFMQAGSLTFTTARKFKGLEAKILIITDVNIASLADEEYKHLFYVASTRAMHELHILSDNPQQTDYEKALDGIMEGRRRVKNKQTFENHFQVNIKTV